MTQIRIATFNLENFDETREGVHPSLVERVTLMKPQIRRLPADIACFQEVHGQERPGQLRALLALKELLAGTNLEGAALVSTKLEDHQVFDVRNLVIATNLPVIKQQQLKHDLVAQPHYQRLTATPPDLEPVPIVIERPILHAQIDIDHAEPGRLLHIITVHLKSKIPSDIPGQVTDKGIWSTADSWAEGSFLSSMKRMSQALEVRRLVDQILNDDPEARIIVAGDFNAEPGEVPVQAICGNVEDTNNKDLATRVLVPIEHTIPGEARYTLFHHGRGQMIDHMLVTRNLLAHYRGSEIHNEILHDDTLAFATDDKYPESDHAPVVATFDFS
ncbi:endonuclease/exonuclease/phosphatase family protein [Streptomyces sp. ISL-43]|uniref:endonuclease/exonuclease/phosphatase family protein n=1 Tax=Streptomyces sp. ISL-43 TaxID=2819183 RepID=UPI001BE69023|nr:endonuclease/exonuclease/phosphatase family protein [Streptomyces sp. ISL-43]MBT2453019.1 endonuclease/exonuclease/phosphatase family protein [Streptomyces sp. ISL-43]